jgi:tetratricopeptide (TPR) repeat protein
MTSARTGLSLGVAVAVLMGLLGFGSIARADDAEALRKEALALNDVTGDDPIRGETKALIDNPTRTKKLLAVAVQMAKEKDQPFSFNGALILARASLVLRDPAASQAFYQVCADQARKLQSVQKLVQAYSGMMKVIDFLYLDKKYEASVKMSQEFLEALSREGVGPEFKAEVMRHMIRALSKEGKGDEANRLTENLLKAKEDNWRNTELKAWLLNEKGKYEDAVKAYQRVMEQVEKEDDKDLPADKEAVMDEIRETIMKIYAKQGKVDDAYKVIDAITKPKAKGKEGAEKSAAKPAAEDWRNAYLKAYVQSESGHAEAAAKIYEELLTKLGKDDSMEKTRREGLQAQIRYILSGVYVDMDRLDKATEQLQTLLGAEPDSPRYNNDLGYIWADHDKNLDEAEKMIRKALDEDRKQRKEHPEYGLDEDKDNAAYLDSMGWVLFKQKKYPEAKKYLLEAVKDPEGQHIEIMDHLGDVHMALGEKADAISTWKKALQVETTSNREKQRKALVEKKLKANQ